MPYCHRCGNEHKEGATACSSCHTPLATGTALEPPTDPTADLGYPNEDPYFPIWRGDDEPLCSELGAVLEEVGILHRSLHAQDRLLHLPNQAPHEIAVPGSLYGKAVAAIKEAFGKREGTDEDAVALLPSPFASYGLDPMLDRDSQDASVEIWSGTLSPQQETVEDALWNNKIIARWQWVKGRWYAFVFPEDESRARELIRDLKEPQLPG